MADGLVIPSLLDRRIAQTQRSLREISDASRFDQRGIHRLGNGMSVTREGEVIVEPRSRGSQAATSMETDDMQAKWQRFQEWVKSEGVDQRNAEQTAQERSAGIVTKTTDPVIITPPGGFTPSDQVYEFGTPIDTTEIIAMCEETGLYEALPEVVNGAKTESWRELSNLYNASGTAYIGFTAGDCPDFMAETTDSPKEVSKKHIGKMQSLTESDIVNSMASIAAGYGVKELLGPYNVSGGPSLVREGIKSLLDKEIKKLNILVINAWDYLLAKGDATTRPLEFNGFENYVTSANGARVNVLQGSWSGTFSATRFDEWLAGGCAKPTHIFGHPTSLQALKVGYFGLWSVAQQNVSIPYPNTSVIPGVTFGESINTSVGPVRLISDSRFTRTNHGDGSFTGDLFALRMTHNGEPLIYRGTQIPLSYKELPAGCSAVSFEVWAVTALIVKWMCAQARYTSRFQGKVESSDCNYVFGS